MRERTVVVVRCKTPCVSTGTLTPASASEIVFTTKINFTGEAAVHYFVATKKHRLLILSKSC